MQSLINLSIDKIPLIQIWEEKLFESNLPQEVKDTLNNRFTLNNLFQERLLNDNLDWMLFYRCLKNIVGTGAIWRLIFNKFNLDPSIWLDLDVLDQKNVKDIAQKYNVSIEELNKEIKDNIEYVMAEIIVWLENQGPTYTYGEVDFSLCYLTERKMWKILITETSDPERERNPLIYDQHYMLYHRFDDAVKQIYNYIQLCGKYKVSPNMNLTINALDDESRKLLSGMYEAIKDDLRSENTCKEELEDIWKKLETAIIDIYTQPLFSPEFFKDLTTVIRIGDCLHVVQNDEYEDCRIGDTFTFNQEDSLLLLVPFILEKNYNGCWRFREIASSSDIFCSKSKVKSVRRLVKGRKI